MRLDPVLVHKTRALELGCKEIDLRQIRCKTARNPHKRSSPMYLYLRDEVNALAEERHAERRRLDEEKEAVKIAAAASRRAKLLKKGITEESVPEPLRVFVFGDHFSSDRKVPETHARHVTSHYHTAVRAGEVLSGFAKSNSKSTETYQAVMNFVQTHKRLKRLKARAILCHMFELHDLQTDVLKIVGVDILGFLKKDERASADLAIPEFGRAVAIKHVMRMKSLESAFARAGVEYPPDSKSLWRIKRFQDDVDVEDLIQTPVASKRKKSKKQKASVWPEASSKRIRWTASDVAESVKSFQEKRKDPEVRRASLKAAMSVYKIPIRPDSRFAQQYILGEIDVDAEEIAAVMRITKALFEISHRAYTHLHAQYESLLRTYVWKHGASWAAAVTKTLGDIDGNLYKHHFVHEYEYSDVDEFDVY